MTSCPEIITVLDVEDVDNVTVTKSKLQAQCLQSGHKAFMGLFGAKPSEQPVKNVLGL